MKKGFAVPVFGLNGYEAGLSVAGPDVDDSKEANSAVELIGDLAQPADKNQESKPMPEPF